MLLVANLLQGKLMLYVVESVFEQGHMFIRYVRAAIDPLSWMDGLGHFIFVLKGNNMSRHCGMLFSPDALCDGALQCYSCRHSDEKEMREDEFSRLCKKVEVSVGQEIREIRKYWLIDQKELVSRRTQVRVLTKAVKAAEAYAAALRDTVQAYRSLICTRVADGSPFYLAQQDLDRFLSSTPALYLIDDQDVELEEKSP